MQIPDFRLVQCDIAGEPVEKIAGMPDQLRSNCIGSAQLYTNIGFVPPWVSYVALADSTPVGGGAFVGPPVRGRVELAYFTLDECEGRGFATRTARGLIEIARDHEPGVILTAKTLPETNASTRILQRHGFGHVGDTVDDDVGQAWLWELRPASATLRQ